MFDNLLSNLIVAAIVAWLAEWLFPTILAALLGAVGVTAIGTFEVVMFVVFVGLSLSDCIKAHKRASKKKDDDDKS